MNGTTTINYEKFDLLVEWTGEKPEPETGFRISFEIEKILMFQRGILLSDVTDLIAEFDLWREIEDKVDETLIEQVNPDKWDLFDDMKILKP